VPTIRCDHVRRGLDVQFLIELADSAGGLAYTFPEHWCVAADPMLANLCSLNWPRGGIAIERLQPVQASPPPAARPGFASGPLLRARFPWRNCSSSVKRRTFAGRSKSKARRGPEVSTPETAQLTPPQGKNRAGASAQPPGSRQKSTPSPSVQRGSHSAPAPRGHPDQTTPGTGPGSAGFPAGRDCASLPSKCWGSDVRRVSAVLVAGTSCHAQGFELASAVSPSTMTECPHGPAQATWSVPCFQE